MHMRICVWMTKCVCIYSPCHLVCYFAPLSAAIAWHVCFRKLSSVGCVCFSLTLADVWNSWDSVVFIVFLCTYVHICVRKCTRVHMRVCVCAFTACGCRYVLVWMCARHVSDLIRWILTRPRLNPPDVPAVTPHHHHHPAALLPNSKPPPSPPPVSLATLFFPLRMGL